MPKPKHPAPFAITIACDEDRTYYFYDCEDFEDFARGLLVTNDDLRISPTDFKMFHKVDGAWVERDFDPYDLFEDIDDTPYPVAHGQLLANYGQWVNHRLLWDIAQGNENFIELVPSASTSCRMHDTYEALQQVGAWGKESELGIETDSEPGYWLTEI